jgi:hypothetical protein
MRIMSRPRVLFAVLASCFLLAGCGSGPGQAGAAVIIGDHVVSIDQVQALIDRAVQDQPLARQMGQQHKLDLIGREAVKQLVVHDVLTKVAKREGLVVNEAQISQTLAKDPLVQPLPSDGSVPPDQAAKEIVIRARDHREALTDVLLQQQLALKYLTRLSVTFDVSPVSGQNADGSVANARDKAIEKAKLFAADPAAAMAALQQDAQAFAMQAAQQGQQPPQNIGIQLVAAQSPDFAATALFGVPAGTVIAFQPSPADATWLVVVVRNRVAGAPVVVNQATQPTPDQLAAIGQRLLQPDIDAASPKINPRYGVWDPVALNLAPSAATTTGIVLPLRGTPRPQP